MLLDGFFRPGDWAARLSHGLGLQGRVTTERRTMAIAGRRAGAEPLKIGFASDFHAGPTTHLSLLEQATAALIAERPDVVLFGGDFVTARAAAMRQLTPLLAAIHAPCGKFAVLGNHDLRANSATVIGGLRRAGVSLLTNCHSRLPAPFDDISICGLTIPRSATPRADLALDGVEGVRIVLMHSPHGLLALEDRQFDLALCGHTHGGQIADAGRARDRGAGRWPQPPVLHGLAPA
jgi:predicted MPP superfamily phosphohydrolase